MVKVVKVVKAPVDATDRLRRFLLPLLALAFLVGLLLLSFKLLTAPREVLITGKIVSLTGQPISGALVTGPFEKVTTDKGGQFELLSSEGPQWLTVSHPNFLPRTRAATSTSPLLVRLTPDDGETISIHFVGDTMFGRRFYDPNEDGSTEDGLLQPGAGAQEHSALLRQVQPLFENADLTVVNLETPLVSEPYYDPTKPRPQRFHPTKEFAFASDPAAATALREVGTDVIGLANNHVYDLLEKGAVSTLSSLQKAGFSASIGYFGAGLTEQEAWRPAVVLVRGTSVAFLGCTTVLGVEHPVSYVASRVAGKGGAAACTSEQRVWNAVADAVQKYDVVVFQIHGGPEYDRSPPGTIQNLASAAREAGASLVVNHHPHVVSGFNRDKNSLTAWSLGNFLIDQTVWPTFESYLLAVHLKGREVVAAYTEPLIIEGYLPRGLTGKKADYVARGAAGRQSGPFLVEDGAMVVDTQNLSVPIRRKVPVNGGTQVGTIYSLNEGWSVTGFSGEGKVRPGRDILWVGSFENESVDSDAEGGALWDLTMPDERLGPAYAYEGKVGVRLRRRSSNTTDLTLSPRHRILIDPGSQLSVTGMVRASGNATLSVQLSWYSDTAGGSDAQVVNPLSIRAAETWQPFRIDAIAPEGIVAVGLFLRLEPPKKGGAHADFDDIRLVQWAPDTFKFSQVYDHVRVFESATLQLANMTLPGAKQWLEEKPLEGTNGD